MIESLLALAFAVARILGVKGKAFQAFAHSYVTYLIVSWYYTGLPYRLWLFVALSTVEAICFTVGLLHGKTSNGADA